MRLRLVIAVTTFVCALVGAPGAFAASSDLFISEYVEGSSNNKALEIFNDTGVPVDLAAGAYNVQMFSNGSTSPSVTINLREVADDDVFVQRIERVLPIVPDQTNGAGWFNGNDAVVLRKGTTVSTRSAERRSGCVGRAVSRAALDTNNTTTKAPRSPTTQSSTLLDASRLREQCST